MGKITLKGNPVNTNGELPGIGGKAPDFRLTTQELADVSLADFKGRKKLINVFPSIDTPVCATSTKKFNEHARGNTDVVMLMVSADTPFALSRFCRDEGVDNVRPLSMMRDRSFAEDYGVLIVDGPLAGITARAVLVLDEDDVVRYAELVPEIGEEPDYKAAIDALE